MSVTTAGIRRHALRALAATILLSVPLSLVSAGSAQAADHYSPVGTWNAQVTTSLPSTGTTTFSFLDDGTMNGTDTWCQTGRTTFSYDLEHPHKDSTGAVDGTVVGHQDAVLSDKDHWTSHGTSQVLDLQGNLVSTFTVDVSATRTS
jgi:hypothetical protein